MTVTFEDDRLILHLDDGRRLSIPLERVPRLRDASDTVRQQWRLIGGGVGIRWEALDEDLSVAALRAEADREDAHDLAAARRALKDPRRIAWADVKKEEDMG